MLRRYSIRSAFKAYIFLSFVSGTTGQRDANTAPSSIFRKLLNQQDYRRSDPPRLNETTVVRLGMYIPRIHGISEKTQEFSITFYLRQWWTDPRLEFSHFHSAPSQINLGQDSWETLWIPDIYFQNLKDGEYVDMTVSNRLITLSVTGEIYYATAIKAVFTCPMKVNKYPFDTQMCPIVMQSFSSMADVLKFEWSSDSAVNLSPDIHLFSHTILEIIQQDCSQNYSIGTAPCLFANFQLQRRYERLIIQIYFPAVLMVILSWIPFWIDTSIDILVGLMIVMALLMQTSTGDISQISYITAMGVWFVVCILYVFLSLVLYTVAQRFKELQDIRLRKFRVWSRFLLPVSFCLFCAFYFFIYISLRI